MRFLPSSQSTFLAIILAAIASHALAAARQWDGSSTNTFGNPFNWTPHGVPGDGDTATITGGTPNSVPVLLLSNTDAIDGLTLDGGAQLRTNGNQLLVDDTIFSFPIQLNASRTVVAAGSNLVVNSGAVDAIVLPTTDFRADFVTIQNSGAVTLLSPTSVAEPAKFWADRTISNLEGGFLRGSGIIQLGGLLNNDGTLASLTGDLVVDPAPSGPVGTADLDGANEIGIVAVAADTTLTINAAITDSIDGQISIADGGRLKIVGDANVGTSDVSLGFESAREVTGNLTLGQADDGTPLDIVVTSKTSRSRLDVGDEAHTRFMSPEREIPEVIIDDADGTGGTLRLTQGARYTTTEEFFVSYAHDGNLLIDEGAQLTQTLGIDMTGLAYEGGNIVGGPRTGSNGTATVTGAGSAWNVGSFITVGTASFDSSGPVSGGDGTLNVLNGAVVNADVLSIGAFSFEESSGEVIVDDATINAALRVGSLGNGSLTITNRGMVISQSARIGENARPGDQGNGTVLVEGAGSEWNVTFGLTLAGGEFLGSFGGGQGALTVRDSGRVNAGFLELGGDPLGWVAAELTIESGGLVDIESDATLYKDTATTGTSTLNLNDGELRAGTFRNEDALNAAGSSRIRAGLAGTVSIFFSDTSKNDISGTLTLDGDTLVENGAFFDGFGNLRVNGGHVLYLEDGASLIGVDLVNNGQVQLGEAIGDVGNNSAEAYRQATDAALTVTLAGEAFDEFDSLGTKGDIELDGTLNIELSDYDPVPGTTFEILRATSGLIIGEFAEIVQPSDANVRFVADYNFSDVTLTTFFAGDADADGDVDGADFLIIQRTDPSLIPIWEAQYGSTAGILAAAQQVPEPTALLLVVFSLVALSALRFP